MSDSHSTPDPHASSSEPETAQDDHTDDAPPPEKSWVWLALVAVHLGATFYATLSVLAIIAAVSAFYALPEDDTLVTDAIDPIAYGVLAAVAFVFAFLTEVVAMGLHRRRKWAWFAALPLFGLWSLSVAFPLGAMGLYGLLMRGSRREFGMVGASEGRRQEAGRIDSAIDPGSSRREGELHPFESSRKPGAHADGAPPSERSWVWLALVGGHLGAATFVLFAIGTLAVVGLAVADVPKDEDAAGLPFIFGYFAVFSLIFAIGVEVITIGMHRRRQWAWFAGFAMFVLYLAFLFIPIGALGLCGLLMGGSRREFGIG